MECLGLAVAQGELIASSECMLRPNPSLEWTATGKALGPRTGQCHHPSRGPSAFPASAPSAQTLGVTGRALLVEPPETA